MVGLYAYRGYIGRMALAEMREEYLGSVMGGLWNVLRPLSMIVVYSVVFGHLMTQAAGGFEGRPYWLYLCAALLPWHAFNVVVAKGSISFTQNAGYLRKLPVPEDVFPAKAAVVAGIALAISWGLLMVFALGWGLRPSWHWALAVVPMAGLVVLGYAAGLLLGVLNAFFRDVQQITDVGLGFLFWLSPVAYDPRVLPAWVGELVRFNPVYHYLMAVRELFLFHRMPSWESWAVMVVSCVVGLGLAYGVFGKLRKEVRDVL
jgi:lipopolysaccharide transport system permease protein